MSYVLYDSYGVPQCDYEMIKFADWGELIDYIESTPELEDRIFKGYAAFQERNNDEDL